MTDNSVNAFGEKAMMVKENIALFALKSLILLTVATCTIVLIGYVFLGTRTFHLDYWDSPFLSVGIGGILVYIMYKARGTGLAATTAVLLALLNATYASRFFGSTFAQTFVMLLMVVLLCHYMKAWKIEMPVYGRLLLLGPLFGIALGLDTLIMRLLFYKVYILVASKNNFLHGFKIGVGLAIGLELAEWINRRIAGKRSNMDESPADMTSSKAIPRKIDD
jgi:hypothetical protein